MKYFRWKAILPLALFVALVSVLYLLFMDRAIR